MKNNANDANHTFRLVGVSINAAGAEAGVLTRAQGAKILGSLGYVAEELELDAPCVPGVACVSGGGVAGGGSYLSAMEISKKQRRGAGAVAGADERDDLRLCE